MGGGDVAARGVEMKMADYLIHIELGPLHVYVYTKFYPNL